MSGGMIGAGSDDSKADVVMTTNGDMVYYDSGRQRLAKGTDGQTLTLASGLPSWATSSAGGKWEKLTYATQTSAGASMQTTTFTPKDFMKVFFWNPKGSGTRAHVFRLGDSGNIDTGSNYTYARFNSGTYETSTSSSAALLQPTTTVNSSYFGVVDIMNLDGHRKAWVSNNVLEEYVGAGTVGGGWNETNQADIILFNASIHGGTDPQIESGAFIEVWGCDKDA